MWTWTPTTSQTTVFLPSRPLRPHTHHPKFTKTFSRIISSNPSPKSPKHKPKLNPENEEKQVSSSDLLWAWQRASTEKRMKRNIKKKKKKQQQQLKNMNQWSSDSENDDSSEWSDVRPLCIKSDWATRLDELEKRLLELKFVA